MSKAAKDKWDRNGYRLDPVPVSETCWLYGEAAGLTVVQEERDVNGKFVLAVQHLIPWSAVDRARGK